VRAPEAPAPAHTVRSETHSAEQQRREEVERNAEPEQGDESERNAEPQIEREPSHPEPERVPSAVEKPGEDRNFAAPRTDHDISGATTNRDGATVNTNHDESSEWNNTTTTTTRDGHTTIRTNNRDGSVTTIKRGANGEWLSTSTTTNRNPDDSSGVAGPLPHERTTRVGSGSITSFEYPDAVPAAHFRHSMELDSAEAESTLRQLNETRASLRGINRLPIPEGRVISTTRGTSVLTGDGRSYVLRSDGTLAHFQSGLRIPQASTSTSPSETVAVTSSRATAIRSMGTSVSFRHDGKIISLRTGGPNGINIHLGARGERVITTRRADQSTLVSTGRRSGYLEKTIDRDGQTLLQRTYLSGARTWTRTYIKRSYPGSMRTAVIPINHVVFKHYLRRYGYTPAFYGWAYNGWASPASYRWNWTNRRWYLYYSLFFAPFPTYSDGSYWLTDYVLGQTLADGYDMQQTDNGSAPVDPSGDANSIDPGQQSDDEMVYAPEATPISFEVKQAIAAEVHQQLAEEMAATASSDAAQAPAPDDPAQFMQAGEVFVVSTPVTARVHLDGRAQLQQCNLSPGDVLRLVSFPIPSSSTPTSERSDESTYAQIPPSGVLEIISSQRADCPAGVQVILTTVELQDMENDFQAQLDDGLHALHSRQGTDGLPVAPSTTETQQPALADPAASLASLSAQLQALQEQANQAETHVTQTVMSAQTATNQPY
jgi:hypothetical protein